MIAPNIGELFQFRGATWQVRQYDDPVLDIKCLDDGTRQTLPIAMILADDTYRGPDDPNPSVADQRLLDLMPARRRKEAEFWYAHMFEVKHGFALTDLGIVDAEAPSTRIADRLSAKRNDLQDRGIKVSMRTLWRRWRGFNDRGVVGCADQRGMPGHVRLPNIDYRVELVMSEMRARFVDKSTPTTKQIIELTRNELVANAIPLPCRTSMYDLNTKLDRGEHTTGDATSRRSYAASPQRTFGKVVALLPGEEVQLDTTPLDASVIMPDGEICKVDLAAGIDVATGTVTAAVLRPNACKTVDAIELLTKSMIPQQMLPGWTASMATARDYLPNVMASQGNLESSLAVKPIIDVRGVVVDRAKIFVSDTFLRALETRGINYRVAPPRTPTAKPHIERLFKTIADDFVRYIPSYKGRSVSQRGRRPEKYAVWPLPLLQALLDEWILTVYQTRPHAGLRIAGAPRMELSPNQIYQAMSVHVPTPPRPLSRDEWISLQPCRFRVINRYGINLENLIYTSQAPRFHDMKRAKSANRKHNGKWEVRFDPNNLLQVWVRDETNAYDEQGRHTLVDNGWIECRWVLADHVTVPFGIDVLHAVRRGADNRAINDKRVLDRVEAIHRQLLGGPPTRADEQPLSRKDAFAGRANLARQQLCTTPSGETADPDPGPAPQPVAARLGATSSPRVEPMRAMRLTEGW